MSDNLHSFDELQLHQRLLAGDKTAPEEVAVAFIDRLKKHLAIKYPQIDQDNKEAIWDATITALMDYIEHPQNYNPNLRGLYGYLKMAAEGDMNNYLAKQKRRRSHAETVSLENVALLDLAGNIDIESESIARQEAQVRLLELSHKRAAENKVIAANELDRRLLALIIAGERRTSEFAKVLGITHLPKDEQKRIVKQHKDRLKLQRKRKQPG